MAHFSAEVAMTGTAISLATIFPKVTYVQYVRVQGLNANANPIYTGDSTLTLTTNRGASTGPIASVQQPIIIEANGPSMPTSLLYVVGTAAEVALITVSN